MGEIQLLYVIAALGLLLVLARVGRIFFRLNIHAVAFTTQIVKLIDAGNSDRAIKLASCVPAVPVAAATGALIKAWQRDLRSRRSLRDAVERDLGGIDPMIGRWRMLSVFGALIGLGVVGYAWQKGLTGDPFTYLAIAGGIAVGLAVFGELKAARIRKAATQTVETVIDALKKNDE